MSVSGAERLFFQKIGLDSFGDAAGALLEGKGQETFVGQPGHVLFQGGDFLVGFVHQGGGVLAEEGADPVGGEVEQNRFVLFQVGEVAGLGLYSHEGYGGFGADPAVFPDLVDSPAEVENEHGYVSRDQNAELGLLFQKTGSEDGGVDIVCRFFIKRQGFHYQAV